MTKPLSKTAAIREARQAVGQIIRRSGTDYVIYGPYRASEPNGASTEMRCDSYPKAVGCRAAWIAEVALALMGKFDDESSYAVEAASYDHWTAHDVRSLVEVGLAAARS